MDKELIERIALEEADKYGFGGRIDKALMMLNFLARIDAERGKGAVGEVDGFGMVWWKDRPKQGTPLYLSPTIPEGMALVPIEPTDAIRSVLETMLTNCHSIDESYDDLLAAAQGERNAD